MDPHSKLCFQTYPGDVHFLSSMFPLHKYYIFLISLKFKALTLCSLFDHFLFYQHSKENFERLSYRDHWFCLWSTEEMVKHTYNGALQNLNFKANSTFWFIIHFNSDQPKGAQKKLKNKGKYFYKTVLDLAGMDWIFFLAAHMVLCFESVTKLVLITQQCFV